MKIKTEYNLKIELKSNKIKIQIVKCKGTWGFR